MDKRLSGNNRATVSSSPHWTRHSIPTPNTLAPNPDKIISLTARHEFIQHQPLSQEPLSYLMRDVSPVRAGIQLVNVAGWAVGGLSMQVPTHPEAQVSTSVSHRNFLSSLVSRLSPFATRHSPLACRLSSLASRLSSFTSRLSSFATRLSSVVSRHSPLVCRLSSVVSRLSPLVCRLSPLAFRLSPPVCRHVMYRSP